MEVGVGQRGDQRGQQQTRGGPQPTRAIGVDPPRRAALDQGPAEFGGQPAADDQRTEREEAVRVDPGDLHRRKQQRPARGPAPRRADHGEKYREPEIAQHLGAHEEPLARCQRGAGRDRPRGEQVVAPGADRGGQREGEQQRGALDHHRGLAPEPTGGLIQTEAVSPT